MARHDEDDDGAVGVDFTGATLLASGPTNIGGVMRMVRLANGGVVMTMVDAHERIEMLDSMPTAAVARFIYEKLPQKHAPFDPPGGRHGSRHRGGRHLLPRTDGVLDDLLGRLSDAEREWCIGLYGPDMDAEMVRPYVEMEPELRRVFEKGIEGLRAWGRAHPRPPRGFSMVSS